MINSNEKLVRILKINLIVIGFWERPLASPKLNLIYRHYSKCTILLFRFLCLGIWAEFIRLIVQKYDYETITSAMLVFMYTIKVTLKLIAYKKLKVVELLNEVVEKEEEIWKHSDKDVQAFYNQKVKLSNCLAATLTGITFCTVLAVVTMSCFQYNRLREQYTSNVTVGEVHLGYQLWTPYNKLNRPNCYYVSQLLFGWEIFNFVSAQSVIVIVLLVYATTRMEMLQLKIRKLIPEDRDSFDAYEKVKELVDFVEEHRRTIRFCQRLNGSLKFVIFVEYAVSSLDLATAVTNFLQADSTKGFFQQTLAVCLLTTQIVILGWAANELKLQSERVADAIFESHWFNLSPDGVRLVKFVLQRAQKPLVVTIGPFGAMTTQSAVLMLRAAYSYVSIMNTS